MKKKIILTIIVIILLILDIYLFFNYIYLRYKNKYFIENTDVVLAQNLNNSPFKINKIILYSSAYGENKNTKFQNANWVLDIYQYTDIALYLNSSEAVKSLSISNFKSNFGNLYYLDSKKFGTEEILRNYEVNPILEYTVLNDSNEENLVNYNTPVFFADSSNPITLKFVNMFAKNFIIENNEKLKFNGSLLEKAKIKLENLKTNISFDINIKNYNNEEYNTTIYLNIPIENKTTNIFKGNILEEKNNQNIVFEKKILK